MAYCFLVVTQQTNTLFTIFISELFCLVGDLSISTIVAAFADIPKLISEQNFSKRWKNPFFWLHESILMNTHLLIILIPANYCAQFKNTKNWHEKTLLKKKII